MLPLTDEEIRLEVGDQHRDRDKRLPITELPPQAAEQLPLARDWGAVDVSALRARVLALPEEAWTDAWQAKHNVAMRRPGHDRWGVGKIVFNFCDDFMQRTFLFPWWAEWADVLHPLFESVGVAPARVVRCLLARMPPGCVIDTHHDTGEWVGRTHRMHMPVQTDDRVRFRVGVAADRQQQVPFREGRCIELNNRSKHSVANEWDTHRIHLIWDWVETAPPPALALPVGARLRQTRRTVALEEELASWPRAPIPAFVVVGEALPSTTQLFACLLQHGMVARPRRGLEPSRFFDADWDGSLEGAEDLSAVYTRRCFYADELRDNPTVITGEFAPSYLAGGREVRERVRRGAPGAKIIAVSSGAGALADWADAELLVVDPALVAQQETMDRVTEFLGLPSAAVLPSTFSQ